MSIWKIFFCLFLLLSFCRETYAATANGYNYAAEFDRVYREINTYAISDSVWHMWRATLDSHFVIPKDDSITAVQKLADASNRARDAVAGLRTHLEGSLDSLEIKRQTLNCLLELEKARVDLETSIKLNPFDYRTQKYLIWIYQQLADMYTDTGYFERSAALLEMLVFIVKDDPQLHFRLGEQYMWLQEWEKAHANIQHSIDLILDTDWELVNTQELFKHYMLRAEAEIKLGNVSDALLTLNYAKLIAPGPDQEQQIQWQIDWINWDDGNLENSRRYDELQEKLSASENHQDMKKQLLALLETITSKEARYEIQWQIAKLQFQYLNERTEAIVRIRDVVEAVMRDSASQAENLTHKKYINDYGLMCYNLGVDYVQKQEWRLAFLYFYQSVCFEWDGIGKSYLQLANLSKTRNEQVLNYCDNALEYANALTLNEIGQLYHLLFQAHVNQGQFEEAKRWYLQWSSLQH